MKKHLWTLLSICVLTNSMQVIATEGERPKIGLVLSGGGARGAAHIGVIEKLEELNIPIDLVVGTSMGAVIGGLYASGVPIETIKRDFTHLNWDKIFSYNIDRNDLYYRRKLDSDIFLIKNFISYSNGSLHIPYGIITGQSLYEIFNGYILTQAPIKDFNQLPIPFKAVSTDLVSGKAIVLDHGDLALALLASMAVPGIISPVDSNGYLLVDGGVSCNLPIQIAKGMGAEILIVVDVSTPLSTKAEIIDLTGVLGQLTNILTNINVTESKALLTDNDILLIPDVTDIGTSDFRDFNKGIRPGRMAADDAEERLRDLSSTVQRDIHQTQRGDLIRVDKVRIKNENTVCGKTYCHYLDFGNNRPSAADIKHHIDYLYGLDIYTRIYYGIDIEDEQHVLVVEPKVDVSEPLYIQTSILLDTDFQDTNTFGFLLGITNPHMNKLMGEWRILGQIGQGERLLAEYYQPLTTDLSWYINPVISAQQTAANLYFNYDAIAVYLAQTFQTEISFGKTFSNWGRLYTYWEYQYDNYKLRTGAPTLPSGHARDGQLGLTFEWDTVDNLYFPHHGLKGAMSIAKHGTEYGGDSDFSQFTLAGIGAIGWDKHSFVLGGNFNRTIDNVPNFPSKFYLGGLFELTGLSSNEIFGDNSALLTAIYFYQFKSINLIPNRPLPLYVGASAEAGGVWGRTNLTDNRVIGSGSLFVAADSLIGPLYFAFGATDNGRKSVQLLLRPAFH